MTPTPTEVRQARESAGLTQSESALWLHMTLGGYQHYEYGKRRMPKAKWEAFQALCLTLSEKAPSKSPDETPAD